MAFHGSEILSSREERRLMEQQRIALTQTVSLLKRQRPVGAVVRVTFGSKRIEDFTIISFGETFLHGTNDLGRDVIIPIGQVETAEFL